MNGSSRVGLEFDLSCSYEFLECIDGSLVTWFTGTSSASLCYYKTHYIIICYSFCRFFTIICLLWKRQSQYCWNNLDNGWEMSAGEGDERGLVTVVLAVLPSTGQMEWCLFFVFGVVFFVLYDGANHQLHRQHKIVSGRDQTELPDTAVLNRSQTYEVFLIYSMLHIHMYLLGSHVSSYSALTSFKN